MEKQDFLDKWAEISHDFNVLDKQLNEWANDGVDAMPADLQNTLQAFAKDVQNTVDFEESTE